MEHTRVNTPQYVCFNQKSGEIYSIGASIEEGYQYFEVSLEEVLPIKTFKEKMTDYIVAFDRKEKCFVLKKNKFLEYGTNFCEVYKAEEVDAFYDVLLTIDKTKKICYITTGLELLDTMKNTNVDMEKEVTFSLTKKGDPHILFDVVTFGIKSNEKKKLELPNDFSVYTNSDMATCVYQEIT